MKDFSRTQPSVAIATSNWTASESSLYLTEENVFSLKDQNKGHAWFLYQIHSKRWRFFFLLISSRTKPFRTKPCSLSSSCHNSACRTGTMFQISNVHQKPHMSQCPAESRSLLVFSLSSIHDLKLYACFISSAKRTCINTHQFSCHNNTALQISFLTSMPHSIWNRTDRL